MGEPRLSCGPVTESYRFAWVHSFTNLSPTAVRITLQGRKWTIVAVRLSNAIDRRVAERKERELTEADARRALAAVYEFGFWIKSGFAYNPDVSDGATWIVEGRRETAYHAVVRGNVDEAALRRMALVLFQLSGTNPGPIQQP